MSDENGGAPAGGAGAPASGDTPAGILNAGAPAGGAPPVGGTPAAGDTGAGAGGAPAGQDGGKPAEPAGQWPDNWRDLAAGGDADMAKLAQRYATPSDVMKALKAAQTKISSGQMTTKLGENPTEEELATFRKENGIPEKPEAYEVKLPNGVVLGDQDAPLADGFKGAAHAANLSATQFNKVMDWYFGEQTKQQEALAEGDTQFRQQTEDTLRNEWGGEYRGNVQAVNNLLALAPDGVAQRLLGGRMADGSMVANDPAVIKWLHGLARELNPAASALPPGMPATTASVTSRIAEIEKVMREDQGAYWKDQKMQEEYRALLGAKEKMAARG